MYISTAVWVMQKYRHQLPSIKNEKHQYLPRILLLPPKMYQ